jgi:hypothetical protein
VASIERCTYRFVGFNGNHFAIGAGRYFRVERKRSDLLPRIACNVVAADYLKAIRTKRVNTMLLELTVFAFAD